MPNIATHDNPTSAGSPIERHTSWAPTEHDDPIKSELAGPEDKANAMDLTRTMSIAETLSFPREAIFVSIVCSAQLATRKYITAILK